MTGDEAINLFAEDLKAMIKQKSDPRDIRHLIIFILGMSNCYNIGVPIFVVTCIMQMLASIDMKSWHIGLVPIGQSANSIRRKMKITAATLYAVSDDKTWIKTWMKGQLPNTDPRTINRWVNEKPERTDLTADQLMVRFKEVAKMYNDHKDKKS